MRTPVVIARQVRNPRRRQVTPRIRPLDSLLQLLLGAIQLPGREEIAVGKMREAELLTRDADEALDVSVPRRQVCVANRPVDTVAVAQIRLEIEIARAQAHATPDETSAAQLVTANPAEILIAVGDVRVLAIVDEEVLRRFAERVVLALDG